MKKKKVFALFRNPATYIDPLLQKFARRTDLYVAISVNKPHEPDSLKGVRHLF